MYSNLIETNSSVVFIHLHLCFLRFLGFKIGAIENLSVLQDQFDVLEFSDNELRVLENLSPMNRLTSLLISNNYISRVASNVGGSAPNVDTLILTNNKIASLSEIDNIASFRKLQLLSLLENPVCILPRYRLYVIHKIPSLKCLDFQKVRRTEREEAAKFFKSAAGKQFLQQIASASASSAGASTGGSASAVSPAPVASVPSTVLTEAQKAEVRAAIQSATTKEEIDRIERQLRVRSYDTALIHVCDMLRCWIL